VIRVFRTTEEGLCTTACIAEKGVWVNLVNPSQEELITVSAQTGLSLELLQAALDEEERPRIESGDGEILVLIAVPITEGTNGSLLYDTIPLGIVINHRALVTVSLQETPIMEYFEANPRASFATFKKTRFLLQILLRTATLYLRYLREIDKKTNAIEEELQRSLRNAELIRLLNLEKSLVYFTTALRSNEIVMEKLLRSKLLRPKDGATNQVLAMYPEDQELLEDVITENKQAIEMCQIYSSILSGLMDAFASVISNNLNIVMKFLTSVTILLTLPTLVTSFYGMNVALPLQSYPWAYLAVLGGSAGLTGLAAVFLAKRNML